MKFRVTARVPGFEMANGEFGITITNHAGKAKYVIGREDMLVDSKGRFYFMLKNVKAGYYFARMTIEREDDNFDDGVQRIVDRQFLCAVGRPPCRQLEDMCPTDGVSVAYERAWSVNVDGMVYLCESDGTPILDSEGRRIYFLAVDGEDSAYTALDMTAAEFKQLIEGRTPNGHVDTMQEALDVMHQMDDNTGMEVMGGDDVDDMMSRILGTSSSQP